MKSLVVNFRSWRKRKKLLVLALVVIGAYQAWVAVAPVKEIALIIGEPWEDMRARSSASIGPAIAGRSWGRHTKSDARLRFINPQFGFVTPEARFFTISFRDERVSNIRMSPQVEPLLIDDTMNVLMDLQDQWRAGGWTVIFRDSPEFVDTPASRIALRDAPNGRTTYWRAGEKFQALLNVGRFADDRHPGQERYLITLAVARPWLTGPPNIKPRPKP